TPLKSTLNRIPYQSLKVRTETPVDDVPFRRGGRFTAGLTPPPLPPRTFKQDSGQPGGEMIGAVRHLLPQELSVAAGGVAAPTADRLLDRPMIVLVGLTGAGKTTTVERLQATLPLAAVLPDRRALTDRLILPLMTGAA